MRLPHWSITVSLFFCLLGVSTAQAAAAESPTVLTPDPTVAWGKLQNGLRYALMQSDQPKDKVSIRLRVACGSLQEQQNQRGLAHYLEHLAFNGTTNYPPGSLVTRLQHLGLAFGAHTNAHTSFEETVYKLDLPDAKAETIATGLTVMADWAGGMLLEVAEVEKERGVILSELRDRDGVSLRQTRGVFKLTYAGTLLADRLPIGYAETISQADRALIASYYDAWYRPAGMVLVVVGAIQLSAVETQIQQVLGTSLARGPDVVAPPVGALAVGDPVNVLHLPDTEAEDTSVMMQRIMAEPLPLDSLEHRRAELERALAEAVLARRMRSLVEKDPACPLQSADAFSYHFAGFAHAGIQGVAKAGRAQDALALIAREYARLIAYGPTATELATETKAYAVRLATATSQAGTRTNPQLAQALYQSLAYQQVFMSPEHIQALEGPLLSSISAADIVEELRAYRARPGREVAAVFGREDLGAGAVELIRSTLAQVASESLARPTDQALTPWGYPTDFSTQQAAGFWTMDPSDAQGVVGQTRGGLRIQTRASTSQPNQILLQIRFEAGITKRAAGVAEIIERGFFAGGLGKHPADEESTLFADSSVKLLGISVGEDHVSVTASCTPPDYQRCLERLAAHLTDPGWRPEAEARVKQAWLDELQAAQFEVAAMTERRLQWLLVAGDPTRRQATIPEAQAVTFAQAKAWLMPILTKAPLTVTVVGDIAQAQGFPDMHFSATGRSAFAAAAPAMAIRQQLPKASVVAAGREQLTIEASVPKALVRIVWPSDDLYDIKQARRTNLLAQCLSERLRTVIREELGAAYSPGAWNAASEAYHGSGAIHASIGVTPELAAKVAEVALSLADILATKGIDEALLDQVKTPVVKGLAARKQRNDWWLGTVMPRLATQPFRLAWAADIEADFAAVTAAELSSLAKRFLRRDRALLVIGVSTGSKKP